MDTFVSPKNCSYDIVSQHQAHTLNYLWIKVESILTLYPKIESFYQSVH